MSLQNGIVESLKRASGGQRMASHPRPEIFKALNNSGAAVGARMVLRLCTAIRSAHGCYHWQYWRCATVITCAQECVPSTRPDKPSPQLQEPHRGKAHSQRSRAQSSAHYPRRCQGSRASLLLAHDARTSSSLRSQLERTHTPRGLSFSLMKPYGNRYYRTVEFRSQEALCNGPAPNRVQSQNLWVAGLQHQQAFCCCC